MVKIMEIEERGTYKRTWERDRVIGRKRGRWILRVEERKTDNELEGERKRVERWRGRERAEDRKER